MPVKNIIIKSCSRTPDNFNEKNVHSSKTACTDHMHNIWTFHLWTLLCWINLIFWMIKINLLLFPWKWPLTPKFLWHCDGFTQSYLHYFCYLSKTWVSEISHSHLPCFCYLWWDYTESSPLFLLPFWDSCFSTCSWCSHPTAALSCRSFCTPYLPPNPLE